SAVSDEARLGANNAGQAAIEYRFGYRSDQTSGGVVQGAFAAYYSVIDQVNRVLAKIDEVEIRPIEAERKENLRAQLLAMRAISHFGLIQSYSGVYDPNALGVPVMLESNPLARPARNTMGE